MSSYFDTEIVDVATTWQMSLRGLTMGAGTPYRFQPGSPAGLGNAPVRSNDITRDSADGAIGAGDRSDPRLFRSALWILGDSPAHVDTLARALKSAWRPSKTDDLPLVVRITGESRVMFGRPRRCELDQRIARDGILGAAVEFTALDPFLYSPGVARSVTIPLGDSSSTPGLAFPAEWDWRFQPPGSAGPGVAFPNNKGSAPAPIRVSIPGPAVNPRIENRTTGISTVFPVTLADGDTLVVDGSLASPSVTLNGTDNLGALGFVDFPTLDPGTNELAYRSDDDPITASAATVQWRDTDS